MPIKFDKNNMEQAGARFGKSGHPTYWANIGDYAEGNSIQVNGRNPLTKANSNAVYKGNKKGAGYLSELEVGLSAMWEVCAGSLTAQCDLVVEGNQTVGVLSKKLPNFQTLGENANIITMSDAQKRELAKILVLSYCLEEDDLHRGNIGFSNGHVVKIDHDMSLYQSVSSVSGNRRGYLRINDEHRFGISAADINGFPVLTDANIHYWPTKYRVLEGSPGYGKNAALREQFTALQYDPVFQEAKFDAFFEFINTSPEEVQKKIIQRLGNDKPETVSTLVNAFMARQAEMRVTLLAMPEAQAHLRTHPECNPGNRYSNIDAHDTPLHIAIKTGCLHQIDISKHSAHIDVKVNGKTPLDLAKEANNLPAIKFLLQHGASVSRQEKQSLLSQVKAFEQQQNSAQVASYRRGLEINGDVVAAAQDALAKIRDDMSLSLDQRKEKAVLAMQVFAKAAETPYQLKALVGLIDSKQFNFMRQLSSDFWIIRQIRGSHGVTSTYKAALQQIQSAASTMQEQPQWRGNAALQAVQDKSLASSVMGKLTGLLTRTKTVEFVEQKPMQRESMGMELPDLQKKDPVPSPRVAEPVAPQKPAGSPSVFKSLRDSWNRSEREGRIKEYAGTVLQSVDVKIKDMQLKIFAKVAALDAYLKKPGLPASELEILLLEKSRYITGLSMIDEIRLSVNNIRASESSDTKASDLMNMVESVSDRLKDVDQRVGEITERVEGQQNYKVFYDNNVDNIRSMVGGYALLTSGVQVSAEDVKLMAATLAERHADKFKFEQPAAHARHD